MTGELSDRIAIITGAASGIGRATAVMLARADAAIAVIDRDAAGLGETATLCEAAGARVLVITCDLSATANIPDAVAQALAEFGRLDILVNCAGTTGRITSLFDVTDEDWDLVHTVNLKAPMLMMKHVAAHMIACGGGGRIVNVTSSSAHRARSRIAYASSKAALTHITRVVAAELGKHDINVNAVAPGMTDTPMTNAGDARGELQQMVTAGRLENFLHRLSEPEDVAATVLFLCLPASRQITAQTIHTSAGSVI